LPNGENQLRKNLKKFKTMKLQIKHLAPYLPYKILVGDGRTPFELTRRNLSNVYQYITEIYLRPLSDLTKEIEHNGEKFVPIEWLFNNLVDATDVIEFEFGSNETPIFQIDDGWNHCMSLKNDYGYILCLSFDSNTKSFMLGIESRPGVEWCMISNQYEMFQKLFEWHFDLFGLIENNLAIDINTIR